MRDDTPLWRRDDAMAAMRTMHWQPTLNIRLHGGRGAVLWGYRQAAVLQSWRIWKKEGRWQLSAVIERAETFMCRQRPLLFTAPRERGQWAWGIDTLDLVGTNIRATLGEPEQ